MKQKQMGRKTIELTKEEMNEIRHQAQADVVVGLLVILFTIVAGAMVVGYLVELFSR